MPAPNKRSATSSGAGSPSKKPRMKTELLKLAEKEQGNTSISIHGAKKLWLSASDGPGVTQNEFATLAKILETRRFSKRGRAYLDTLVNKTVSGTSMYKSINGTRYDRSALDLADHLHKDGKIGMEDARLIWADVLDGPGVTPVEAATIQYIMNEYKLSEGATKFFRDNLAGVPASAAAAPPRAAAAAAAPAASAASPAFSGWHGTNHFFGGSSYNKPLAAKAFSYDMGAKAFGLFVNDEHVYVGSENGVVSQLKRDDASEAAQFELPAGVKCLVADNGFLFAGCNNGSLYDLSCGRPRLVAELEDFEQVLWLDIHNGIMAASDSSGNVAMVNCEGETLWKKKSSGDNGWMVRVDDTGVYHGHSEGVTKYNLEGNELWHTKTAGVLSGWQRGDKLYAALIEPNCFDGEIAKRLTRAGAKTGEIVASLMWNNSDDLDLHVYAPSGEHISYMHKRSQCGGELDVDMNAGRIVEDPVENVYWKKAPSGKYRVSVIRYSNRVGDAETKFEVHLKVKGQDPKKFEGVFTKEDLKRETVCFEFEHEQDAMGDREPDAVEQAVVVLDKATGKIETTCAAGSSVPSTTCSEEGLVYAAVPHGVKCFNAAGEEQWELGTGAGNAMTMQRTQDGKLFAVCRQQLVCLDVSDEAVAQAKANKADAGRQLARDVGAARVAAVSSSNDLETAASAEGGVVVECVKQGSKIRVRPVAGQGYEPLNTQFPRNIRADGARFVVDKLVRAGNFYRVQGDIRRLA